jgi:hypothetical protein
MTSKKQTGKAQAAPAGTTVSGPLDVDTSAADLETTPEEGKVYVAAPTWLYNHGTGEGRIFLTDAEAREAQDEGWNDRPPGSKYDLTEDEF